MCFRWPDACPQFEKPKNQKIHENLTKNLIIPWLLCKVSLIERKGHSITLLTKWKQLCLCINLDIEEAEMDGWSFPLKSDPSSASVSSSAEAAFLSEKRTMYIQQCTTMYGPSLMAPTYKIPHSEHLYPTAAACSADSSPPQAQTRPPQVLWTPPPASRWASSSCSTSPPSWTCWMSGPMLES